MLTKDAEGGGGAGNPQNWLTLAPEGRVQKFVFSFLDVSPCCFQIIEDLCVSISVEG